MARGVSSFSDLQKGKSTRRIKGVVSTVITAIVIALALVAYFVDDGGSSEQTASEETSISSVPITSSATTSAVPITPSTTDEYRVKLEGLEIKGRAPRNNYEREHFGQAWSDDVQVEFGHNGCDTRNDILARDLSDIQVREGTQNCIIENGVLNDPFSGEVIQFQRGQTTSSLVQIDHIVALSDAWQKGAQQWDEDARKNFANDPDNLIAVNGSLNQQKGAGDAATWLPPNQAFRCDYARSIITVKDRYGVWVTEAEHDALSTQLNTCVG